MLEKKIGLEFEFILYSNKLNSIVFPGKYGFSTDEFIILGEERTGAFSTMPEIMGDFYNKWYKLQEKFNQNNLAYNSRGYESVTPEFYAGILRSMSTKEISVCKNLYKTDILKLTDAIVENGVIKSYYISCGLHLHFSLMSKQTFRKDTFSPFNGDLYKKLGESTETKSENVMPIEWMKKIIRGYDKLWLRILTKDFPRLKFRYPGYYETKPWGFEYRSLPFNDQVIKFLPQIISDGFKFLDQIKFI